MRNSWRNIRFGNRAVRLLIVFNLFMAFFTTRAQQGWYVTDCQRSMKQSEIWYFGEYAGIDFRSGAPVALTDQNAMKALNSGASMCDSLGNLQFFTNGKICWDRTFNPMPNATGLLGNTGMTQPALIVPWPDDPARYLVFTADMPSFMSPSKGFCCTLIDMNQRSGLGDAVSSMLNKPLLDQVNPRITAVHHADGTDYWVIVHHWGDADFYAYQLTPGGLAPPVISSAGSIHSGTINDQDYVGYMKTSPDGSRLALALSGSRKIELFNFNTQSGNITFEDTYTVADPQMYPYGVEFSPDNHLLYVTVMQKPGPGITLPSSLLQFDLASGLSNPVEIAVVPDIRLADIQLAIDGKIYISPSISVNPADYKDYVEVIYNPNRPGTACNFNSLGDDTSAVFRLNGRKSVFGLPNFVRSFVNIPHFNRELVCHQEATRFRITNEANIDSVTWNFGDGSAISSEPTPVHRYAIPGEYLVTLTEFFDGESWPVSIPVTIYSLPKAGLTDSVLMYNGSTVNLKANEGFRRYLWSPTGETTSMITVGDEGRYIVDVEDLHCCTNSDTTRVKVFEYNIPNAFTPNGDGLNDVFKAIGLYSDITFSMKIFDRWGQQVFESDDIDEGWNGIYGGKYCASGTYAWIIRIAFRGQDIINQGDLEFKGTVILLK